MNDTTIVHDERTVAIENASYRLGYLFLTYGLLVVTAYRSFKLGQQSWDLLGLVLISGVFTSAYRARQRAIPDRWMALTIAAAVLAVLIALAVLFVTRQQ